ncbi:putative peptide modification system cyclase [Stenotrophomonas maltophilia]|nr:putative peptide modification system cyclase [Stenotrophomonas maltophilia]
MNAGDGVSMSHVPQLRALLFTDLCDSTSLVERIGDAAAANLFQQHDRLVLRLQHQWNGLLIDRSDGLFLVFERPIDALGFALAYQNGLAELPTANDVPLMARAGLHVGEVILWRNSADAVAVGAKRVEVEGLAKPMAARLMQLALPRQILVSNIAESVMRRSTSSLGEQSNHLKWRSFGRWRFKGVAQPMENFGVQGAGMPTCSRPRPTPKANRLLPLWRRPAAVVAQGCLIIGVVAVIWFATRPEAAIAFAERDWVVLGDVRNLTGEGVLNEGMEQAFRISLEQSRYVNVLGGLKVRETLTQMLLAEDTPVAPDIAIQIAKRNGARAVLLPTIREVSGKVRVSIEVVDPSTEQAVYTLHSDGIGLSSVLRSTDVVVAQLRNRLGEAVAEVKRASAPLPRVATSNLDALYAYSRAQIAYGEGRVPESVRLFDVAIGLDPGFAMAHVGKVRSLVALGHRGEARKELEAIEPLSSRLSTRELLYFQAWEKEMVASSEAASLDAWKTLADLYLDHHGAHANVALGELQLGRYVEAEQAARRSSASQNGLRSAALQLLGRTQIARGKFSEALDTLGQSVTAAQGQRNRHLAAALAASGNPSAARDVLSTLPTNGPSAWLEGRSVEIDNQQGIEAVIAARKSAESCEGPDSICEFLEVVSLVVSVAADQCITPAEVRRVSEPLLKLAADQNEFDRGQRLYFALAAIYAGQRSGIHVDQGALSRLGELARSIKDPRGEQLFAMVQVNDKRMRGDRASAVQEGRALIDGSELFQVHSVLAMALAEDAEHVAEEQEITWLRTHRGVAYAEFAGSAVLQALNVRDSRLEPRTISCRTTALSHRELSGSG